MATIELMRAANIVVKALSEDREYYESWKANIAVAFQDEYYAKFPDASTEEIWEISNAAAARFLRVLIALL